MPGKDGCRMPRYNLSIYLSFVEYAIVCFLGTKIYRKLKNVTYITYSAINKCFRTPYDKGGSDRPSLSTFGATFSEKCCKKLLMSNFTFFPPLY
jgi:hypothetical protein